MKSIIALTLLALAGCNSDWTEDKNRSHDMVYGGQGRARDSWSQRDDCGGRGPYTAACSRDIIHHEKDYNVDAIAYRQH